MTRISNRTWIALLFLLSVAGCSFMLGGGSAGSMQLSLQTLSPAPPLPLVGHKSSLPLYLVLDPAKVPAQMPVLVNGTNMGASLVDMNLFVTRDLRRAFGSYFDQVFVVAPAQAPSSGPGLIVDLRLDRIETSSREVGNNDAGYATRGTAMLTWSVGLRPATSSNYLWSFATTSHGERSEDLQFGYRTLFEHAIADLFADYAQQNVAARLPK